LSYYNFVLTQFVNNYIAFNLLLILDHMYSSHSDFYNGHRQNTYTHTHTDTYTDTHTYTLTEAKTIIRNSRRTELRHRLQIDNYLDPVFFSPSYRTLQTLRISLKNWIKPHMSVPAEMASFLQNTYFRSAAPTRGYGRSNYGFN
jgi:hypothetical protein